MVILAKLIASTTDSMGYITYVFKSLDEDYSKYSKYVMCTRYPNWEHRSVKLGDVGYLSFEEITAGRDKWFDGKQMIPYNYDAIQFIKFIEMPSTEDVEYIM